MSSGTLQEAVVSKHSLSLNDCFLFYLQESHLFWNRVVPLGQHYSLVRSDITRHFPSSLTM